MLRSVTVRHMERVLGPLEGRLRRRVALGTATLEETDALDAVAGFRASLPTVSWRLRVGLLALGTLVLSRVLARLVPSTLEVNFGLPGEADLNRLFDKTLAASQPTTGSVGSAIDSLFEASLAELAVVAFLLVLSLYLLLRPMMTSFRLKRMLFNLHPDAENRIRDTPASWSVSRATGVYDLERSAFEQVGARPPPEPPLDLVVPLAVPALFVTYMVTGLAIATYGSVGEIVAVGGVALAFLGGPPAIRIAWLAAAWRARRGGSRSRLLLADEVAVPWRGVPVRRRSPLMIAWLSLVTFYVFVTPAAAAIWYWCARDLRDFGHARGVGSLAGMQPGGQAAAIGGVFWVVPAFVPLALAPGRIRVAQIAAGIERPLNSRVLLLLPLWPVLCFVLQRELNRLWESERATSGTASTPPAGFEPATA